MKNHRIIKSITLTPQQIENISNKGINVFQFYNWRYFLHLQLKRKMHKQKLQSQKNKQNFIFA